MSYLPDILLHDASDKLLQDHVTMKIENKIACGFYEIGQS
jgi:hypothetical protein